MTGWTNQELDAVARAGELHVEAARNDGSLRKPVTIWHVRVGDDIYIRSAYGPDGGWYRSALRHRRGRVESGGVSKDVTFTPDADHDSDVDAAYRAKYGSGSSVQTMIGGSARATTLRVTPA